MLEPDDLGFREVLFEFQDVANLGAAPGVDRLVLIADGADIVARAGQKPHQLVLRTIRILVFIDEEILKASVVIVAHFPGTLQKADRFEQQVVEVHRVRLAQFFSIFLVNVCDALSFRIARLQIDLLRIKHVVFGPGNPGQHGTGRELLVVDAQPPQHALDYLLLIGFVVDDKILRETDRGLAWNSGSDFESLDVSPQHAYAERMEGGNNRLDN